MKRILLCLIAGAVSLNALAFEEKAGFYISAGFGQTDLNVEDLEDYYGVELPKPDATEITFGYRINNYWTAELGYTDFGEIEDSYDNSGVLNGPYYYGTDTFGVDYYEQLYQYSSASASLTASTIKLGTVLSTDATEALSVGLRLGFHMWDAEAKGHETMLTEYQLIEGNPNGPVIDTAEDPWAYNYDEKISMSEDGTDLYYGLVANLNIKQFTLSAAYTVYEMDDLEPSTTTIALGYNF